MSEYKECPYCAEQILARAMKCKHCQSLLEESPVDKPVSPPPPPPRQEKPAAPPPLPPAVTAPSPAAPAAKKKKSPLKILAIVAGSIVGLAVLGFIALVVIGLLMSTPAEVTGVVTAQRITVDNRAADITDTFYSHIPEIFVVAEVAGAAEGTLLTAIWYWDEEDYLMDSVTIELPRGDSRPYFSYAPAGDWPTGYYRVELLLDNEPETTARFTVIIEEGAVTHIFDSVSGDYHGELRSGVPYGYGEWLGQDGAWYHGDWLDGEPHGYGVYEHDEVYYQGEWFEGTLHGHGFLTVQGVFEYTGGFKEGDFHGEGTLVIFEDDQVFQGNWVHGEFVD